MLKPIFFILDFGILCVSVVGNTDKKRKKRGIAYVGKFSFNIFINPLKSNSSGLFLEKIEAIPAYSTSAHPHTAGWIGYLIELDNVRIYHSGDSGLISEMNDLVNIDIFFVTVREPYMMSPKEVIQAINTFRPKIVIPIHWIEEEKEDINYIVNNSPESTKIIILEMK